MKKEYFNLASLKSFLLKFSILILFCASLLTNSILDSKIHSLKDRYLKLREDIRESADVLDFAEVVEQRTKYPWSEYFVKLKDTSWISSNKLREKDIILVSMSNIVKTDLKSHYRFRDKLNERAVYLVYKEDKFYDETLNLLCSTSLSDLETKSIANSIFTFFIGLILLIQLLLLIFDYYVRLKKRMKSKEIYQLTLDDYLKSLEREQ